MVKMDIAGEHVNHTVVNVHRGSMETILVTSYPTYCMGVRAERAAVSIVLDPFINRTRSHQTRQFNKNYNVHKRSKNGARNRSGLLLERRSMRIFNSRNT